MPEKRLERTRQAYRPPDFENPYEKTVRECEENNRRLHEWLIEEGHPGWTVYGLYLTTVEAVNR